MDITEIKKLKEECQDKIKWAISAFEDKSQCTVSGVSISKDENNTITVKLKVAVDV